jgi:hypothetical protein
LPASRDQGGRVLLRPIELSTSSEGGTFYTFELQDDLESTEDRLNRIRGDFNQQFPNFDNRPFLWVEDTFDDENFVIVSEGAADHFRVTFEEDDEGTFHFAERAEWAPVKQRWVDAARRAVRLAWDKLTGDEPEDAAELLAEMEGKPDDGGDIMSDKVVSLEGLTPEQRAELAMGLFAELAGEDYAEGDLGKRFNALVVSQAEQLVTEREKVAARDRDIAEFSKGITGGTDEVPRGLPVTQEEVERFLAMLSDEALDEGKRIFGKIAAEGLVEFTEDGHSRDVDGKKELPEEIVEKLESGELSLADLKEPVLALGDLSAYDLTKWAEKAKED